MFAQKLKLVSILILAGLVNGCDSNKTKSSDISETDSVAGKIVLKKKKAEGTMTPDTIKGNIIIPPSDPSDFGYTGKITDSVLLTFEKLLKILPEIPGYKHADTANGEGYARRTSGGIQSYVKHKYANGKKTVLVEIIDCNMTQDVYKGLLTMYERNTTVQKPEEYSKLVTGMPGTGNKAIYITYPPLNSCRFIYGVSDRFLILVSGEQFQDEEILKSTALKIKTNLQKVI